MQAQIQNHKDLRCERSASRKKLYDDLLMHIYKELGEKEKNIFQFWFRNDLPWSVLELRDPLKWFRELEQEGKLSWNDVSKLIEFLKKASRDELISKAQNYQARIKIIEFFHKYLQVNLPELCLDNKLNEKWCSEQELPKRYLKRCQDLFRQTQNYDESRNHVRCLFSKGILLLVNSCRPSSSDRVQSACLKLLYLADLFYNRFKKMIVTDKELLNIKPLPSGKFLARDNRRRTPVIQRRRISAREEVQQELPHRRCSCEVIQLHARLCLSFLLGLFTSLLGMFIGRREHLEENNENALEGELSD